MNINWRDVKKILPELHPAGNPPHEFVAWSDEVLVCGWVNKEFIVCKGYFRRGSRGLNDRSVWWDTADANFWDHDHLITHWVPLTEIRPSYKEASKMKNKFTVGQDLLDIQIIDEKLVISIGIDALFHAISFSPNYGLSDLLFTNKNDFLNAVIDELRTEDESGATIIHNMFDEAANNAVENGCDGVEFRDKDNEE